MIRNLRVDIRRRVALLTKRERLWWLSCFPLGLLTASLETIGGIVIFALTAALLDATAGGSGTAGTALINAMSRLGLPASPVALTMLTAAVYLIKNAVLLIALYYRTRVFGALGAGLSTRITHRYLTAPYSFHLVRNSSDTSQNILSGVPAVVRLFDAIVALTTEVLVVVGLATLLMRAAFLETSLAVLIIGTVVGLFMRVTRGRYQSLGARHFDMSARVLKALQQAVGGFKEVTVFGREAHFARSISADDAARMRVWVNHSALEAVPRLLTEAAFVLGMVGLVVALELRTGSVSAVIPFIGLYAYAGFRLIPAGHRIAFHAGAIRYEIAASEPLRRDLDALTEAVSRQARGSTAVPAASGGTVTFRERLNVSDVSYSYDGAERAVLNNITLEVRRGECVAIVGATGAGKTTLVDIIMGLLEPSTGSVSVDGTPTSTNVAAWRRQVGYVPQSPFLLDDTLRRNIAFGVADGEIDHAAVASAIEVAQLQGFIDSLPAGLDTVIGERGVRVSGGERQRISIARALYGNPALLVLDEATSSLDPGTERALTQAIERLRGQKTLIVIAHRLSTVERADRLIVLRDGRVEAVGRYDELSQSNEVFRALAALADAGTPPRL